MTIFFPDLSGYQAGLKLLPGTPVIIAKATEGTNYTDLSYWQFRAQAAIIGAVFVAYHWLGPNNFVTQAAHCHNVVGNTPLMLDCEELTKQLGPDEILAFVEAFRGLGGICHLAYYPRWYWRMHGTNADINLLKNNKIGLVSSNYTAYSDTGPGWAPYGINQPKPVQWQYADNGQYGTARVDMNAYLGTKEQYRRFVTTGSTDLPPVIVPPVQRNPLLMWR